MKKFGKFTKFLERTNQKLDNLQFTGVYKIWFDIRPNKIYVGSTTDSFHDRFTRHYGSLLNSTSDHHSRKLQNAFDKYGDETLKFQIIEIIDVNSEEENKFLLEREQKWMNFYQCYKKGYNCTKKAENSYGFKMYEEVLEKRRVKILQYDLEGNFIREWKSYTEITKNMCGFADYSKVLSSSNHSACGFLWRKKTKNYPLKIDPYINLDKVPIWQYSLNGDFIKKWDCILDASINLHIPCGNISKHLQGITTMCYGYYFSKEPKLFKPWKKWHSKQVKVRITNLKTNEILEFDSLRKMELLGKISRTTVANAIKKHSGIMIHKKLKVEYI